jgi:hypothetical protein
VNRLLGDPFYYPIYDAAQELDVTISVHTGGVPQLDLRFFDRLIDVRCLQHPVGQMHQMVHLMFSGVFRPLSQSTHGLFRVGIRLGALHAGANAAGVRALGSAGA